MEFGRSETPIAMVDHGLPQDGRLTIQSLPGTPAAKCNIHVGLSRWGRKEWCGSLYPEKTREIDFLSHYAKHFNCIELNATFFSMPQTETVKRWRDQANQRRTGDFLFLPKVAKEITHLGRLREKIERLKMFVDNVSGFAENLGPIFFQMGDHFGPKYFEELKEFIIHLPKGVKFFFEVRNRQWFENEIDRGRYFDLLASHGIGAIITDTSGRRDSVHMELTTKELFLRFVGNGGEHWDSDFERIDEWVERIGAWMQKGLENVYFIVHQYNEADSPKLASYVIDRLNERLAAYLTPLGL